MAERFATCHWAQAAAAALVVTAFLLGSVAGRMLIEVGARAKIKRIASITLGLEISLIALVWPVSGALSKYSTVPYFPLSMLAVAMGLQTATLTRVGPLTIHTTFVTGMVNRLAELMTSILFRHRDLQHATSPEQQGEHRRKFRDDVSEAYFVATIWFLYAAGAATGAALAHAWNIKALYVPCFLLLSAIAADQWQPISAEEEREQLEQ